MKKIISISVKCLFLFFVIGFFACSSEDEEMQDGSENGSKEWVLIDDGPLRGDSLKYQLSGSKWDKTNLTYCFVNQSSKLTKEEAYQAVRNAFNSWARASILTFTEVTSVSSADLKIGWYIGEHGDKSPFDGVGNVLAHAFYPPPLGGSYAGLIHIDDSENWGTNQDYSKFDLESVALHEIGHALGISHDELYMSSVMYPYTYLGQIKRILTMDDILAIRQIYGGFSQLSITANNAYACVNENVTYTLTGNVPSGATIAWQSVQNGELQSGQGTGVATFKISGSGYAKVKATITNGTSITIENSSVAIDDLTLNIAPALYFTNSKGGKGIWYSDLSGNSFDIRSEGVYGYKHTSFEIYIENSKNQKVYETKYGHTGIAMPYLPDGWYTFYIRGISNCGYTDWYGVEIQVVHSVYGSGGSGGGGNNTGDDGGGFIP